MNGLQTALQKHLGGGRPLKAPAYLSHCWRKHLLVAGRQGFEPRYRGPEPRVRPLDDLPIWNAEWVCASLGQDAEEQRNSNYTYYASPL